MGKTVKRILSVIFFLGCTVPGMVSAAGIGIAPKSFDLFIESGESSVAYLSITNTGEEPAEYVIYADDYESLINIQREAIELAPGESKNIEILIGQFPPGQYQTEISVVAADESADNNTPKAGVRVPFHVQADNALVAANASLTSWIIGFLLLAFLLLLLSYGRNKKRGVLAGKLDAIEETLAGDHAIKMMKHYQRRHQLFVLSLIAIAIAGILLLISLTSAQGPQQSNAAQQGEKPYSLQIMYPDDSFVTRVTAMNATPFSLLTELEQAGKIDLSYDDPNHFGVYVTEINGFKNGDENKYWVYEVNGERIAVSADRQILHPQDQVTWKFIHYNEN